MTDSRGSSQSQAVDSAAVLAEPPGPAEASEAPVALDFRAVYDAEFDYVFHSLRRLGVPERDLEDLIHEVFLVFYRTREQFDTRRPLKPWLFGIAFRIASDYRRRAQHGYVVPAEPVIEHRASTGPAADDAVAAKEQRALVQKGLAALDLDKRAVFVLHDIDGCSMPEIQAALCVPLNTLYSRLRLARQAFAEAVRRATQARVQR